VTGLLRAVAAGASGAGTLTVLHQAARAQLRHPPRMDVYGKRALKRAGVRARGRALEREALIGDLVANTLFYSLLARVRPRSAPWAGLALGLAAGAGALLLPQRLGLGRRPALARRRSTSALTVAWYAAGGLAAGLAARALGGGPTPTRDARWQPFPAVS
jgi:hypothetical protein